MRLQQLRYVIAIAEGGSINAVAHSLFVSQSSLSVQVKDLEEELGITIFNRSSRGITLTADGVEFLSYAREVVEQADLLEARYRKGEVTVHRRLSVSSQHYAFAVNAFIAFVRDHDGDSCEFTLRETRTANVVEDVRTFRSDLGILYLDSTNEQALRRRFADASLDFTPLFRARPHVFVHEGHPLASLDVVPVADLAAWPRYTFEQGSEGALYFSEEPLSSLPCTRRIVASDRATMTGLLRDYDGYLVSTGVRSDEMFSGIVARPIATDDIMCVGYVTHSQRRISDLANDYIDRLDELVVDFGERDGVTPTKAALRRHALGAHR